MNLIEKNLIDCKMRYRTLVHDGEGGYTNFETDGPSFKAAFSLRSTSETVYRTYKSTTNSYYVYLPENKPHPNLFRGDTFVRSDTSAVCRVVSLMTPPSPESGLNLWCYDVEETTSTEKDPSDFAEPLLEMEKYI